jgi:hypothetical protein
MDFITDSITDYVSNRSSKINNSGTEIISVKKKALE